MSYDSLSFLGGAVSVSQGHLKVMYNHLWAYIPPGCNEMGVLQGNLNFLMNHGQLMNRLTKKEKNVFFLSVNRHNTVLYRRGLRPRSQCVGTCLWQTWFKWGFLHLLSLFLSGENQILSVSLSGTRKGSWPIKSDDKNFGSSFSLGDDSFSEIWNLEFRAREILVQNVRGWQF